MIRILFVLVIFLSACRPSLNMEVFKKQEEKVEKWRFVPSTIKFNQRTKVLLYGENLSDLILYADNSVNYMLYEVKNEGTCAILYFTVSSLKVNSNDNAGSRQIRISVPTETNFIELHLKIKGDIQEQ